MNKAMPFVFSSQARLGDEIKCKILSYFKENGEEYVLLSNIVFNGKSYEGEYKFRISRTNGELLCLIFPLDSEGYPIVSGKEARMVFQEYATVGFNGVQYYHKSFLFQPFYGIIEDGISWWLVGR